MNQYQEHCDFTYATDTDWDRADASQLGQENPDQAWVCTDRDVWHANPYYQGPPVPHPEYEERDYEALEAMEEVDVDDNQIVCDIPDEDIPF